jgi:acyl-coenzyme A synthetase/AMP-(fatty) acid ligase
VSDARVTRILTCGEILDFETVRAATAAFGAHLQVFNQYGPTECTMTTTAFRADPARELRGPVPIGSPVPGAQVYVLDPEMNPVHAQVGEIYIGGAGVSRGYWRRAGLTAERFLPDPFADVAGARLYRTGDLGLLRTDGVVEFRGRADQQVKIGGVRIELGEIEAALLGIPGVGAAAVVAIEREQGEKLLTAFLVTQGVSLSEQLIRSNLSQWLPASMLPSRYVPMEEMPRTLTGKIDRLRLLETAQQEPVRPRIEPASRTEKLIASVWAKVLRVETFGVSDNLFVLGATSLDAARIANRLATALQVPVPVYAVFDAPTIAELAGVLDSLSGRARQGGDC